MLDCYVDMMIIAPIAITWFQLPENCCIMLTGNTPTFKKGVFFMIIQFIRYR